MNIDLKAAWDYLMGGLTFLQNGTIWGAVFVICLIVGLICKRWIPDQVLSNRSIPPIVWLTGAIVAVVVMPPEPTGIAHRQWVVRWLAMGLAVGFCAWLFHRIFLKWLFKKLRDKFGVTNGLDDESAPPINIPGVTPAPLGVPLTVPNPETSNNGKDT